MLIASAWLDKGEQLLILGLSQRNRELLNAGKPMDISRATHGMAIPEGLKIMIFAGETEASMRETIRDLIGLTTVVDQKDSA